MSDQLNLTPELTLTPDAAAAAQAPAAPELTLEPSTETYLTWEWNPEDGYVYAPDYSYINEDITADSPDM